MSPKGAPKIAIVVTFGWKSYQLRAALQQHVLLSRVPHVIDATVLHRVHGWFKTLPKCCDSFLCGKTIHTAHTIECCVCSAGPWNLGPSWPQWPRSSVCPPDGDGPGWVGGVGPEGLATSMRVRGRPLRMQPRASSITGTWRGDQSTTPPVAWTREGLQSKFHTYSCSSDPIMFICSLALTHLCGCASLQGLQG